MFLTLMSSARVASVIPVNTIGSSLMISESPMSSAGLEAVPLTAGQLAFHSGEPTLTQLPGVPASVFVPAVLYHT